MGGVLRFGGAQSIGGDRFGDQRAETGQASVLMVVCLALVLKPKMPKPDPVS